MSKHDESLRKLILSHVPKDGESLGNGKLMGLLEEAADFKFKEADYFRVRDALVEEGKLTTGRGRGGSVMRVLSEKSNGKSTAKSPGKESSGPFSALSPQKQESLFPAAMEQLELGDTLAENVEPRPAKAKAAPNPGASARTAKPGLSNDPQVLSYRHDEKRRNNPQVGMVDVSSDGVEEKAKWEYDPHLDPALHFDIGRSQVETLIDDALASKDEDVMRKALEELKRLQAPYLNWTGKAERTSFEVDTVSLHVHERIDPATILSVLQKKMKGGKGTAFQTEMFSAPFENLPMREAFDFYKHDRDWSNRLIAGDSLLVMNSLLKKEGMAGKVQMIYLDPPYGIKYGSNFQPFVNKREVKDRKDEDLTQEPEMIKAFRDTWELGIHSYLAYLFDRLTLARDLLSESGSVFIQISDENLHHVRELMDSVFGAENFLSIICFSKAAGGLQASNRIGAVLDYIVWYAKDFSKVKYNPLYQQKEDPVEDGYSVVCLPGGYYRTLVEQKKKNPDFNDKDYSACMSVLLTKPGPGSKFDVPAWGKSYNSKNRWWGTTPEGINRVIHSQRAIVSDNSIRLASLFHEFPYGSYSNLWSGFGGAANPLYVVQTNDMVIQRCLLMTTDSGDLIFDPTCGSGTTSYVAENGAVGGSHAIHRELRLLSPNNDS